MLRMYPKADPSKAQKIENDAETVFNKQVSQINNKFRNIDADIIYGELFANRNSFDDTDKREEVALVNTMISTFADHRSYLEETNDEAYEGSQGLRLKRDANGLMMPLYELKYYGMKSYEEILNSFNRGEQNIIVQDTVTTYRFDAIENDLNDGMTLSQIEAELSNINPNVYNKIVTTLRENNMPITPNSVLDFASRLNEANALR